MNSFLDLLLSSSGVAVNLLVAIAIGIHQRYTNVGRFLCNFTYVVRVIANHLCSVAKNQEIYKRGLKMLGQAWSYHGLVFSLK